MFPQWLDRLQIRYFNPLIRPLAGRIPGLALFKHTGRSSGKQYQTPVTAYRRNGQLAVVLGHGMTDWARNALAAGQADVTMSGDEVHIVNPRIVPNGRDVTALPSFAKRQARSIAVFVADIA
ncbi:nitroreductase family deazaflavin-dependent oxidoreductase [Mycobacterium sp. WMMD1722]|uniref:nitroreductase family deazaflavin-dependent oxidoreductase n=1 Tax=Mycobacterium sp. WMMD1722 TaxID=3404117 RepID=UPI003BF4C54A